MNGPHLKGKEFEDLLLFRAHRYRDEGTLIMGRYGVQGSFVNGEWRPIQSYPDFEGCLRGGRQFVIEAKVCSSASFGIAQDTFYKPRQHKHLIERAEFGALAFLLIHWNPRQLKASSIASETFVFPVQAEHEFWRAFDRQEVKKLTRDDCHLYGVPIEWNTYSSAARKLSPDFLPAMLGAAGLRPNKRITPYQNLNT